MDNPVNIRIFGNGAFPADYLTRYVAKYIDEDLFLTSETIDIIIPDTTTLSFTMPEIHGTNAVLLSSFDVYGKQFENAREEDATDPRWLATENRFIANCRKSGATPTILRLPYLVGTGMDGEMRKRLNSIYRGFYRIIEGVNPYQSVLHVRDLIPLILLVRGNDGVYNVSDGVNPTVNDIARAFAKRINNKRIYTIKEKGARKAARFADVFGIESLNSKTLATLCSTKTVSVEKLKGLLPEWKPTDTIAYVNDHQYSADDI